MNSARIQIAGSRETQEATSWQQPSNHVSWEKLKRDIHPSSQARLGKKKVLTATPSLGFSFSCCPSSSSWPPTLPTQPVRRARQWFQVGGGREGEGLGSSLTSLSWALAEGWKQGFCSENRGKSSSSLIRAKKEVVEGPYWAL